MIRTNNKILALIFFAIPMLIQAQTACSIGTKVTDLQSGKPISGATIVLDGTETGIVTNQEGDFKIPLTCIEHTISLRLLGYKPYSKRLTLNGETPLSIELENISTQLEEVVITSQSSVRTMESGKVRIENVSPEKIFPFANKTARSKHLCQ